MLDRPHQPQTRADAPAQRPEREPRRDNTPTPRTSESRPAHAPKVAASGGRRQSTQGAAAHASAAKQPGEAKEQAKTEIPGASEATTQDATQTADAISDTAVVQAGAAVATEATGQATVAAETPAVNGAAAPLDNGKATWSLNVPKLSNVTVNIKAPSCVVRWLLPLLQAFSRASPEWPVQLAGVHEHAVNFAREDVDLAIVYKPLKAVADNETLLFAELNIAYQVTRSSAVNLGLEATQLWEEDEVGYTASVGYTAGF